MYKALIVDDEPPIRKGIMKLIDWNEFGVETLGEASNGIDALEYIQKENPHIMICDIRMPGMDGLELLKKLRDENTQTKTIILSGYDHFDYVREEMKYKVENYLLKPVNKDELISTVSSVIDSIERNSYLESQMKEAYDVLRNNVFFRLLNNNIAHAELSDKLEFLGLDFGDPPYQAALMQILNPLSDSNHLSLQKILDEETADLKFICFPDAKDRLVVFWNGNADKACCLEEKLTAAIYRVNRSYKFDVLAVVGRPVNSLPQIHLSYHDGLDLLDYKYLMYKNTVISYEERKSGVSNAKNVLNFDIELFEKYLIECRIEDVSLFLDNLLDKIVHQKNIKPFQIRNISNEILIYTINTAKKMKLDVETVLSSSCLIEEIFRHETAGELFDWLKSFCTEIIKQINIITQLSQEKTRV